MINEITYLISGSALIMLGVYFVIVGPESLRRVLAINIMGIGVFMLLTVTSINPQSDIDPIPQAMVLTGIVVAVAATALALSLLIQLSESSENNQKEDNE